MYYAMYYAMYREYYFIITIIRIYNSLEKGTFMHSVYIKFLAKTKFIKIANSGAFFFFFRFV